MWWTHRWRYDSEALGIHSVAKELVNLDNEHRVEGDVELPRFSGHLIS